MPASLVKIGKKASERRRRVVIRSTDSLEHKNMAGLFVAGVQRSTDGVPVRKSQGSLLKALSLLHGQIRTFGVQAENFGSQLAD